MTTIILIPYLQVESDDEDDSGSDVVPTNRRTKKLRVEPISRQCEFLVECR